MLEAFCKVPCTGILLFTFLQPWHPWPIQEASSYLDSTMILSQLKRFDKSAEEPQGPQVGTACCTGEVHDIGAEVDYRIFDAHVRSVRIPCLRGND